MKVMARVGQLKYNKDGVPAGGRIRRRGGRRRRIGTRGYAGRKVVFLFVCFFALHLRQETECFVGRDGGCWESGENRN